MKGRASRHDHALEDVDAELAEKLDWISSTAASHRAAAARLAAARTESERREAAYEEALTKEMHRAALSRLERHDARGGIAG